MLRRLIGAAACAAALTAPAAAGAFQGPAPTSWRQCRGYGTDSIVALAVAHYPISNLGGLGCREAAYQAGFVATVTVELRLARRPVGFPEAS
jgi:hypothetical protein